MIRKHCKNTRFTSGTN